MRTRTSLTALLSLAIPVLLASYATADEPAAATVDFDRDIRPILSNTCFACHGPDEGQRQADLRLDLEQGLFDDRGGYHAVVPGDPSKSELYQRLVADDEFMQMPPADSGKKLSKDQIELFRRWIEQGAKWEQHWSFVPPERPEVPQVSNGDWVHNPIDAFVMARLDKEGLEPSPEAEKRKLIRRVTFDLTGLPPTLEEVNDFVADESPEAYEKVVDRLLDSPHFGEHMARYWLDAARYGDTHGLHLDNRRSIWPYRDWVIEAFNANMPFDQFSVEQLAGDLLPEPSLDQRVATGFNRCNVTTSEGGAIDEEWRVRYAVDRVETTSTVWMGLTTGCAVCHDHKFDPISQKEFFELFAYFNNVTEKPMDGNAPLPPPTIKVSTPEQHAQLEAFNQQITSLEQQIGTELAKVEYTEPEITDNKTVEARKAESQAAWEEIERAAEKPTAPKPVLAAIKKTAAERTADEQKLIRDHYIRHVYANTRDVFDPLNTQLAEVQKQHDELFNSIPGTLVMEDLPEPRETFVLKQGEYDQPGDKVEAGVPSVLPPLPDDAPANRLALARWLVDPAHPLTARVTANRFWQRYFGTGIVKTAEDFGSQGERPSHPKLLDWLAVEFIESGWNVKELQKLIVMSSTYRQSARVSPELYDRDRSNRLLARGPRFRLDAETIRDNALAVSGLLVDKLGGPSVKPYQPPGIWEAVAYTSSNTAHFEKDEGNALYRRSLYIFWKRTAPPPTMLTFDAPSRESCTVMRARTNTPLQALVLMNDEQFVEAARNFAARMMTEGGDTPEERIEFAFELATSRTPDEHERRVLLTTFQKLLGQYQQDGEAAAKLLDVGDSPRNESLDPAEHAAWTIVANLILNLDETVTKG